jgi:hypothetical protein
MADLFDIRGCSLSYYCAQDWDTLVATEDSNRRFCMKCGKDVKYCQTYEEFESMAQIGHCVAFRAFTDKQVKKMMEETVGVTLGIPIVRRNTTK